MFENTLIQEYSYVGNCTHTQSSSAQLRQIPQSKHAVTFGWHWHCWNSSPTIWLKSHDLPRSEQLPHNVHIVIFGCFGLELSQVCTPQIGKISKETRDWLGIKVKLWVWLQYNQLWIKVWLETMLQTSFCWMRTHSTIWEYKLRLDCTVFFTIWGFFSLDMNDETRSTTSEKAKKMIRLRFSVSLKFVYVFLLSL
jgi:hypothetical protein